MEELVSFLAFGVSIPIWSYIVILVVVIAAIVYALRRSHGQKKESN